MLPENVTIVEVGPRDGLQNENQCINSDVKIEFINKLSDSGLSQIEAGSFVSEKSIPQMFETDKVLNKIARSDSAQYIALVPNQQGIQSAVNYKADKVAVFTAVSEEFCQKNINCSISESLKRFEQVIATANKNNIPVRGYISCVMGCPYEGHIAVNKVVSLAEELINMGCYEVSLGDTTGVGTINQVKNLINKVTSKVDINKIAVHFHDTYGQALVNVYSALQMGVSTIDSATGGLGGCPYAKGSSGNLATEDLVYMLNGLNIVTGVNLDKIIEAGQYITHKLNISPKSKVSLAKI